MKKIAAFVKIILILLWTIPTLLLQLCLFPWNKGALAYIIPRIWHKVTCRIIGLNVEVKGTPLHDKQVLFIGNHLSYLDIPAIGSILKASFIAKEDIAHWPVIGYLATLQQTAFISRTSTHAKHVANALDQMVRQGKSLILFPEGTSSAGTSVLPFKSSLFSLAHPKDMDPITLQPFIIDLIDMNGKPLTQASRDLYAWYADMEFAPHIWDFLQTKGATVRLTFLPPVRPAPSIDRKALCKLVETQISSGLSQI